jgi:hypothetical protein
MSSSNGREPDLFISFDSVKFRRAFSYRDVLTSLSLALSFMAIGEILNYYSNEEVLEDIVGQLIMAFTIVPLILNHVIYRGEHKRSNNYIGRVMHSFMLLAFVWIIKTVQLFLAGESISDRINDLILGWLLLFFVLMLFEFLVAILKRILLLFKCVIF